MKKLKIVYFGTPYFSSRFLEKLLKNALPVQVLSVVTRPDRPVGRKRQIVPSPVKQIAEKYNIQVFEIENSLKISNLKLKIKDADICLVFAYGNIIPQELLSIPKLGFLCIHPSLLPKYRGTSPIAYPLILGDKKTGVTIFKMDEQIDHGPIISQEEIEIKPTEKRPDLEIRLTDLGFKMFKNIIAKIYYLNDDRRIDNHNNLNLQPQNHKLATFTRMLEKKDGFIPFPVLQKAIKNKLLTQNELPELIRNFKFPLQGKQISNSARIIYNYFRGLYPWPGIWTFINIKGVKKRLKITELSLLPTPCILLPIKVQLEGKNEVDFKTFQSAYKIFKS